jgi:hypothetical protein
METLKLSKETAKEIYNDKDSPSWIKKILESTFKPETFKKTHFTDLKTFDDCCVACGTSEKKFEETLKKLNLQPDTIAYEKLKIIIKAINQDWIPDWNNSSQYKYWPWFVLSSGFGFSGSDCCYDGTSTAVGSRLCFESREKSDYAGKQFQDIYKDFLTITK